MKDSGATRIERLQKNLGLTRAIVVLSVGVLLPVLLSTSVGFVALVVGESSGSLIFGVLIISFTSAAIGGAIIVTVLLGRRARTARLQADLLGNVTHELRTPLSAIRMYAQTLQMGLLKKDPGSTQMCVDTIIRETEWLEAMIDKILTWRSLAKDRDDLEMVCESVSEVVEESATRFLRMVSSNEVCLEVEMGAESPVYHDKSGLESIVLNLLTNAWKYTGQNKKITLKTHEENDRVVISVRDNGIGIPEKEVNRIFDPFYRVDSRLTGQGQGAGLGLAIVNHLVRAHSGTVFVKTEEGEGSQFLVSLPIASTEKPGS